MNAKKLRAAWHRLSVATLAACIVLALAAPGVASNKGLIRIHEGQFWAADRPFVFTGTNTYYLMDYASDPATVAYVDEVMGEAAAMKLSVIRTWAFYDGPKSDALQTSPGVYQEFVFRGLDYALYRADKLHLRLILTLVNNWPDYGGMDQYVVWSPTASSHDQFYTDANCKTYYKNHVSKVVNRENYFNHRLYWNDPTILAWELANEPRCYSGASPVDTLDAWVAEMSAYVKSIDPNHLVTTGMESTGTWDGHDYVRNHGHASIDYGTLHLWPDWWGWSLTTCLSQLQTRIDQSHRTLIRPLNLGEFGKYRPTATRDNYYTSYYNKLNTYNAASSNFWMLLHQQYRLEGKNDGFDVCYDDPIDATTIAIVDAQSAESAGRSAVVEAFADRVDSYSQGADGGQGAPKNALGFPDAATWSMGRGGQIVLEFTDNRLIDGPGADLIVYEGSILQGSGDVPERATVSVSTNGSSYTSLGTAEGTTAFDIGSAALNSNVYRYVKIVDDGDASGEGGLDYQGFDLNAVRCIHAKRADFAEPVRVEPGADVVVSAVPGTSAGSNDPRNALGPPGGPGWSLGSGGSITLKFVDNLIVDRDGADFIVFEGTVRPDDSGVAESALVSVSSDGTSFVPLGTAYGTTGFDVAGLGLSRVRYVRIEDVAGGPDDDLSGGHGGYDLNSVAAVNYVSAQRGDCTKDGAVDFLDVAILSASYGSTSGSPSYNPDADFNQDGEVDFLDVAPLSNAYGSVLEDYSHADIDGDGCVDADDQAILTAAFGSTTTDAAYDAAADLNFDGLVNSADQDILTSQMGTCPGL